jgi:hypothetical protein
MFDLSLKTHFLLKLKSEIRKIPYSNSQMENPLIYFRYFLSENREKRKKKLSIVCWGGKQA